jgi:hypothetical protein
MTEEEVFANFYKQIIDSFPTLKFSRIAYEWNKVIINIDMKTIDIPLRYITAMARIVEDIINPRALEINSSGGSLYDSERAETLYNGSPIRPQKVIKKITKRDGPWKINQ